MIPPVDHAGSFHRRPTLGARAPHHRGARRPRSRPAHRPRHQERRDHAALHASGGRRGEGGDRARGGPHRGADPGRGQGDRPRTAADKQPIGPVTREGVYPTHAGLDHDGQHEAPERIAAGRTPTPVGGAGGNGGPYNLARRSLTTLSLGDEFTRKLTEIIPPGSATFSEALTIVFVHAVVPRMLRGWKGRVLTDDEYSPTGNDVDDWYLQLAKDAGVPVVTHEGVTTSGYREKNKKGKLNLRGKCQRDGVPVSSSYEYLEPRPLLLAAKPGLWKAGPHRTRLLSSDSPTRSRFRWAPCSTGRVGLLRGRHQVPVGARTTKVR